MKGHYLCSINAHCSFFVANLTCSKYDAFFREVLNMILPGASSKVKLSFVMSFKRLSNHINLSDDYCSQVLSSCIDLIEDPDYDVRMKFR